MEVQAALNCFFLSLSPFFNTFIYLAIHSFFYCHFSLFGSILGQNGVGLGWFSDICGVALGSLCCFYKIIPATLSRREAPSVGGVGIGVGSWVRGDGWSLGKIVESFQNHEFEGQKSRGEIHMAIPSDWSSWKKTLRSLTLSPADAGIFFQVVKHSQRKEIHFRTADLP